MNQINGYCQIELPDRIRLDALKTDGVALTDAEVKPIIKALNLDQVVVDDNYSSYINAWLNKPVIVRAYIPTKDGSEDSVKSIFHASILSTLRANDYFLIQFVYGNSDVRFVNIAIHAHGEETGQLEDWGIVVSAQQITTTNIA